MLGVAWDGRTYLLDSASGSGAFLSNSGFPHLNALAKDSSGILYSMSGQDLIAMDPNSGQGFYIATTPLTDVRGMAFDDQGRLYVVANGQQQDMLYSLDPITGNAVCIGPTGFPGIQGLAWGHNTLYAYDVGSGVGIGDGLLTLDTNSGVGFDLDPNVSGSAFDVQALCFDSSGTLFAGRSSLFTLDLQSGADTLIGNGGYSDLRGLEFRDTGPCQLALSEPSPGQAGMTNAVSFSCADAHAQVAVVYDFSPGTTSVGGICPGLQVQMQSPQLIGIFTADASGQGVAIGFVPPGLSGQGLYIQAIDLNSCRASNLVQYIFP